MSPEEWTCLRSTPSWRDFVKFDSIVGDVQICAFKQPYANIKVRIDLRPELPVLLRFESIENQQHRCLADLQKQWVSFVSHLGCENFEKVVLPPTSSGENNLIFEASVSESRYKIRNRAETDKDAAVTMYEAAVAENDEWHQAVKDVPQKGTVRWAEKVTSTILERAEPEVLVSLGRADGLSALQTCHVVSWFASYVGLTLNFAFHAEGQPILPLRGISMGLDVLDLSRPLPEADRPVPHGPLEGNLVELLWERSVTLGTGEPYCALKHGPVKHATNGIRASRSKILMGRTIFSGRKLNTRVRDYYVFDNLIEDIHAPLQIEDILGYLETDFSQAFSSIENEDDIIPYLLVVAHRLKLILTRMPQGIKCGPALWNTVSYPIFNTERSSPNLGPLFSRLLLSFIGDLSPADVFPDFAHGSFREFYQRVLSYQFASQPIRIYSLSDSTYERFKRKLLSFASSRVIKVLFA